MKKISIDHHIVLDLIKQFKILPDEILEILQFEDSRGFFANRVRRRAVELGGYMIETSDRHIYLSPRQLFELGSMFMSYDLTYINQALIFNPAIPEGENIRAYAIEELGGKIIEKVI